MFAIAFEKFFGALGLAFLLTAEGGYCQLYTIPGISTKRYGDA